MSNCYLCDSCCGKAFDLSSNEAFCRERFDLIAKIVMHDGIERPTDLCEHYEGEDRHER